MASKTFLILALAFAVVLLISSQVSAAKEASSHESEVKEAKYGVDGYRYGDGGYGGYNYGRCQYGCCDNGSPCNCCRTLAEATRYKQAQTHN